MRYEQGQLLTTVNTGERVRIWSRTDRRERHYYAHLLPDCTVVIVKPDDAGRTLLVARPARYLEDDGTWHYYDLVNVEPDEDGLVSVYPSRIEFVREEPSS